MPEDIGSTSPTVQRSTAISQVYLNPFRPYLHDLVPVLRTFPVSVQSAILTEASIRMLKNPAHRLRDTIDAITFISVSFAILALFIMSVALSDVGRELQLHREVLASTEQMLKMLPSDANIPAAASLTLEPLRWHTRPNVLGPFLMTYQFLVVGAVIIISVFMVGFYTISRNRLLVPFVNEVIAEWDVLGKVARTRKLGFRLSRIAVVKSILASMAGFGLGVAVAVWLDDWKIAAIIGPLFAVMVFVGAMVRYGVTKREDVVKILEQDQSKDSRS